MTEVPHKKPAVVGEHAKVLVIGGHRYGDTRLQAGSRPPAALKFPTAFARPEEALKVPTGNFVADVAVGFLIQRGGTRMTISEAGLSIGGCVLIADLTEVDDYNEEARTNNGLIAKNYPGASAISPVMNSPRPLSAGFDCWLSVSGVRRQQFSASDLLCSPEQAIAAWSAATLAPGDIVALGAAAAVQRIAPIAVAVDDEIEIGSSQLGVFRFKLRSDP